MSLRQAAQQALEALEYTGMDVGKFNRVNAACAALRAALAEPEQGPISLNGGRLTQYPDGTIGVGTPAEPEQEPVAHLWQHSETGRTCVVMPDQVITADATWIVVGPLYLGSAPTPRKPLTDAEIWNTYKNLWMFHPAEEPRLAGDVLKFARAIERAHGIGEQHE